MSVADLMVSQKPLYTGAAAVYKMDSKLARKFTLKTRFGDVYKMYEQKGDYILLPRAVCPMGEDKRSTGMHLGAITTTFKARSEEQTRVVEEATALLLSGQSFIVQAPTGFGKTFCALEIAARVARPVCIVVTKEDLYNQWIDEIQKCWGIPRNQIGQVRQNVCDYKGKKIVVAMLHSLVKKEKYPSSLYSSFGLVIFDEVHRIAADTFMGVCNVLDAKLRMGLSATPQRKDGKEEALYAHIGPIMVKTALASLKPKVLRFYSKWTCPRRKHKDPVTGDWVYRKVEHSGARTMHITKSLAKDPVRNAMIVDFIKTCHSKGRDIIIFSDLREHLDVLMQMSVKAGVPSSDMSPYVSGMTKAERELAKIRPVRYATYGMMGEGTDIPWADCAILATPRSDVIQIVGRILREYEDKKQPVVFDIIDQDSPVFTSYASTRMAFYNKVGADIKTMA